MKQNKEDVVSKLLIDNYEKYYRMAYSYVQNQSDAQDIVQEGAYKAIFNCEKLRELKYADTWICRIMINESMGFLKKRKINSQEFTEEKFGSDNEELIFQEQYDNLEVKEAINKLSDKEKTVIILRYFEDMSLEQVAQASGENLSTVKSRIYRALGKLKINLSEI